MSSNYVPPPKSQYEIERDERIARNEAFMRSLGLGNGLASVGAVVRRKRGPPRKRQRGPPRKGDRESLRLKGQPPLSLEDEIEQAALARMKEAEREQGGEIEDEPEETGEPEEAKVEPEEDDDVEIEDAPDAAEVVAEATKAVVPRAKKADSRDLRPCQIMLLPPTDPLRMALVAKKEAESAVYEAALNDFVRRHDLWEKKCRGVKTYQEIFFAIEDRVASGKGSGSDKGTAAKWLCLLMRHKGDPERITPGNVRHWMRPQYKDRR